MSTFFKRGLAIVGLIIFGKFTGFFKDVGLSYVVGANMYTDAFYIAMAIAAFVHLPVYNAISIDFLNEYGRYRRECLDREFIFSIAWFYIKSSLMVSALTVAGCFVLFNVFPSGSLWSESFKYLGIMSLCFVLSSVVCIANARLIYLRKPIPFYFTSIVNNSFFLLFLFGLYPISGLIGVVFSGFFSWGILATYMLLSLRGTGVLRDFLNTRSRGRVGNGRALSTMFYVFLESATLLYVNFKFSTYGDGIVTYYSLAYKVVAVALTAFLLVMSSHLAPHIVRKFGSAMRTTDLAKTLSSGGILVLPLVLLGLHFSNEIVSLIFYRGSLETSDIYEIERLFRVLVWLLPILIGLEILGRINRVLERTKENWLPTFVALLSLIFIGEAIGISDYFYFALLFVVCLFLKFLYMAISVYFYLRRRNNLV